jgi:hypothetical protein
MKNLHYYFNGHANSETRSGQGFQRNGKPWSFSFWEGCSVRRKLPAKELVKKDKLERNNNHRSATVIEKRNK